MSNTLPWFSAFKDSINRAAENLIVSSYIYDTVDPLKKEVILHLSEEGISNKIYIPFKDILNGFASKNEAHIQNIRKDGNAIKFYILLKGIIPKREIKLPY